jgi:hypothetical protein
VSSVVLIRWKMPEKSMVANFSLIAVWILLPTLLLASLPGQALTYRPRGPVQRPTQQEAGGARTPCDNNLKQLFSPLLTRSNYGETVAEYPTFYWLSANHKYNWIRFELFATGQNLAPEAYPEYSVTQRVQELQTVSHLRLPSETGLPPLKLNQEYLWKVTLICSPEGPDTEFASGTERSIRGWIKRVEPSTRLKTQLAQAKGRELYNLYGEEGLWYDALDELARQYRTTPNNRDVAADWQKLLKLLPFTANPMAQGMRP